MTNIFLFKLVLILAHAMLVDVAGLVVVQSLAPS